MAGIKQTEFHACTVAFDGLAARIVTPIQLSQAFDPRQGIPPDIQPVDFAALWDTGATRSVITPDVSKSLALTPVGQVTVGHAGGSSLENTYLVNFYLPNKVGIPGVLVSECSNMIGDFHAIIGMDILAQGDFSITNVGRKTKMTFRIPSIQVVDYVLDADRVTYARAKMNEPCPCGKTNDQGHPIKFRDCHWKVVRI